MSQKFHGHKFDGTHDIIYDRKSRSYRLLPIGRNIPSADKILEAAGFGREEHQIDIDVREACDQVDMGQVSHAEVKPHLQMYVTAWLGFSKDFRACWRFIGEHVLHSELGYACTPSRIGYLFGELGGKPGTSARAENRDESIFPFSKRRGTSAIVEITTTGASYSAGPWLAACQLACIEHVHYFTPEIRMLVRLDGSGRYSFAVYVDDSDKDFFLGALEKYRRRMEGWREKLRRWLGLPMPKQMPTEGAS